METVNRILQEQITALIAPNKAVLIFGARRVGKTVMMRKIVDNYSGRTMMLTGEDYGSLCYPLRLAYQYWKVTVDSSIFDGEWMKAITAILKTFKEQQRKDGVGPVSYTHLDVYKRQERVQGCCQL